MQKKVRSEHEELKAYVDDLYEMNSPPTKRASDDYKIKRKENSGMAANEQDYGT